MKKHMMNACYKCKFRGTIPGNAHSRCRHPNWNNINVSGDPHGIKSGWFAFPFNFDPAWLLSCDGLEEENK